MVLLGIKPVILYTYHTTYTEWMCVRTTSTIKMIDYICPSLLMYALLVEFFGGGKAIKNIEIQKEEGKLPA